MQQFFPADVSLRVSGEIADAQQLFPAARQLLTRALKMQETGTPIVRLFQPGTDGSLIHVLLHCGLKHVYVQPAPKIPENPTEEQVKAIIEEFLAHVCPSMLTGLVVPGSSVLLPKKNPDNPNELPTYALHQFHPTTTTAKVSNLSFAWGDIEKLGVPGDGNIGAGDMQAYWPKPSMYSGAMKRVVQAIYGIGKFGKGIFTDGLNGKLRGTIAQNHYDYRWYKTHGIVKMNGKVWLVEISKARGVLAMILPVFPCTASQGYKSLRKSKGDSESLAVVTEFGGLPTGVSFPDSDADLAKAIEKGTVAVLLSKEDLSHFYHQADFAVDKSGLYNDCGWAFPDTSSASTAVNTCSWNAAGTGEAYPTCEVWQLSMTVNRTKVDGKNKVVGSATLIRIESGLYAGGDGFIFPGYSRRLFNPVLHVPTGSGALESAQIFTNPDLADNHDLDSSALIAPVFAFYNGGALEVVRYRPGKPWRDVQTTLSGWRGYYAIHNYATMMPEGWEIPVAGDVAMPPGLWFSGPCPEWFEWEYWNFYWLGFEVVEAYYSSNGDCFDGRPAWQPVATEAWYHLASNGWVTVDDYKDMGWSYNTRDPFDPPFYGTSGEERIVRVDHAGPTASPMGDGFSAWLNENWLYTYKLLDRPNAFFGTSMNFYPTWQCRQEPGSQIQTEPGLLRGFETELTPGLLQTSNIDIGMCVPNGVREGYLLLQMSQRWERIPYENGATWHNPDGWYPNGMPTQKDIDDKIEVKGFFAGIGVVSFPKMVDLEGRADWAYTVIDRWGNHKSTEDYYYSSWWIYGLQLGWGWGGDGHTISAGRFYFDASIAGGTSKNRIAHRTAYSEQFQGVRESVFVENVPCGMSAVNPGTATFVGAI